MLNQILSQIKVPNVKKVSGMDATFLYGETETSPMHIGSVVVIEGALEYSDFKKLILSKLHVLPKFRQRLMFAPMSIDHPFWVDDPDFNINMHLNHVALPKNKDWKQLRKMASKIFSKPLDQNRPLWEFTFVEGLDNLSQVESGSVAIISKIHHVAIDGMAGAGIMASLFDLNPEPSPIKDPKPWKPKPLPNELSLVLKTGLGFAKNPLRLPKLLKESLEATIKAGFVTRVQHLDLPTAPFTAPHTPLNGIIAAERKWNTSIISLARTKALKNKIGTTLNDIILAICAGALRRYLLEKKMLPKKPLVAMVPVSTRSKSDAKSGNQLNAMLIQLATHIEDPIERLEKIYSNTIQGKTYQGAMGAKTLSNLAEAVPFGIANNAARMYTRFNVAKMHNPVFNVVITNVPGPQIPIYMQGHRVLNVMGMAPIIDGMGLIITVLSMDGKISISPTSDIKSMPDLDQFSDYILDAANELEEHILNYDPASDKIKRISDAKQVKKINVSSYFTKLRKILKENPKHFPKNFGKIQFLIRGSHPTEYTLNLNAQPGTIKKGKVNDADSSITILAKHLKKIESGALEYESALIQGRVIVTGDEKKVNKLIGLIS